MTVGAFIIAAVGLVMIVVIALCARGTIKRGWGVGIRLPAIQQSDEAWQVGHRAALVPYSIFAVVGVLAALSPLAVPALTDWAPLLTVVAVVAGLILGGILGSRAANAAALDTASQE